MSSYKNSATVCAFAFSTARASGQQVIKSVATKMYRFNQGFRGGGQQNPVLFYGKGPSWGWGAGDLVYEMMQQAGNQSEISDKLPVYPDEHRYDQLCGPGTAAVIWVKCSSKEVE
ncbi:hypothetical protein C2G38_2217175 [Gigaspora rosea]|uniref:Uncharacterized protein n=1 Tax=Gigaspora rosea TaxID=44941 RepID=A0A397UCD3_9GLOM|nr:hypothetical protein C2G38_2217175 [Gigaspora rosea]